jgi:hypothetical protein
MRDLRWWATLSSNPHVGRELWPVPTALMFTDASMRAWDAVWNGKVPVSGFFDARNEGSSINELELLAAINGLRAFAQFARAREVTLISDSLFTFISCETGRPERRASCPTCRRCACYAKPWALPYLPDTCPQCSIYGPIFYPADETARHGDSPQRPLSS